MQCSAGSSPRSAPGAQALEWCILHSQEHDRDDAGLLWVRFGTRGAGVKDGHENRSAVRMAVMILEMGSTTLVPRP